MLSTEYMFLKCWVLESLQEWLDISVNMKKKKYDLSAEHHPALEANKVHAKSLHYLSVAINGRLENYVCWKENSYHAEEAGREGGKRQNGRRKDERRQ